MNKNTKNAISMKTKRIVQILGVSALALGAALALLPTQRTITLSVIGHQNDGMIIENIIIHDTGGDGIVLRDVDNVIIRNCEIYNVSEGIAFSSLGNTNNVIIENCNIHDTGRNGIIVKQHPGYNQTNVVIRGNTITNTGTSSTSGAYHGIYMQATDNMIVGNTIDKSTGNGVSIRSSGTVARNRISNTAKSCVRYFSDNVVGASKKLTIENNLCVNPAADYPALSILWGLNPAVVTDFHIRFNTIIGGLTSFQVQSSQFSTAQIAVYGNLYTKPIDVTYTDYSAGNLLTTIPFGVDYSLPNGHPAIGYASAVKDWPLTDIDGNTRRTIDAGAFAFISSSPVTVISTSTPIPSLIASPTSTSISSTATKVPASATSTLTRVATVTPTPVKIFINGTPFVCPCRIDIP